MSQRWTSIFVEGVFFLLVGSFVVPPGRATERPSAIFYPFGTSHGDSVAFKNDDGCDGPVYLGINYPFFKQTKSSLYVCTNGLLSFDQPVNQFTPESLPLDSFQTTAIVAVYWADVDTRMNNGRVYYRETTDRRILQRASIEVQNAFVSRGFESFSASWVFIATWSDVTYYGGSTSTPTDTFQVVLITDGTDSLVMYNYGDIRWTTGTASGGDSDTGLGGIPAEVGFDAGDRVNHYALPSSRTADIVNIEEWSNVAVRGRFMFIVSDSEIAPPGCLANQGCVKDRLTGECTGSATCSLNGDPHYRSFDQLYFDYQGVCKHLLTSPCDEKNVPYFEVFARNEYRLPSSTAVAYTRYVEIRYSGSTVRLVRNAQSSSVITVDVSINGEQVSVPFCAGDFYVHYHGRSVRYQTSFGLVVDFDGQWQILVSVPESLRGKLCGLCGNFDADQQNDLTMANGTLISGTVPYAASIVGDSFVVEDAENNVMFSECSTVPVTPEPPIPPTDDPRHVTKCHVIKDTDGAFRACVRSMTPDLLDVIYQACLLDARQSDGASICNSISQFVDTCAADGIRIDPATWRAETGCEPVCPVGMNYEPSASPCLATCVDPYAPYHCSSPNTEMCVCPEGHFVHEGECVQSCHIGCFDANQNIREIGESWPGDECTVLTCEPCDECYLQARIVTSGCPASQVCNDGVCVGAAMCRSSGDTHYRTFDGALFDYQGTCQHLLVSTCGLEPDTPYPYFEIYARNEHRYESTAVSYVQHVEIHYEHTIVELTRNSGVETVVPVDVVVDGDPVDLPYSGNGFEIVYVGTYVHFQSVFGVNVDFDGTWFIEVSIPSDRLTGKTCGVCGNNDGNQGNDFALKNATSVYGLPDAGKLIGDSYVVAMDNDGSGACFDNAQPQGPITDPDPRCEDLRDPNGPYASCVAAIDPQLAQVYYDNCILDSHFSEGRSAFRSIRTFLRECRFVAGIEVNCSECHDHMASECPLGTVYQPHAAACQPSCTTVNSVICSHPAEDACVCADGGFLLSGRCLPSCFGCTDDNDDFQPVGSEWAEPDCVTATCEPCLTCPMRAVVSRQGCESDQWCLDNVCVPNLWGSTTTTPPPPTKTTPTNLPPSTTTTTTTTVPPSTTTTATEPPSTTTTTNIPPVSTRPPTTTTTTTSLPPTTTTPTDLPPSTTTTTTTTPPPSTTTTATEPPPTTTTTTHIPPVSTRTPTITTATTMSSTTTRAPTTKPWKNHCVADFCRDILRMALETCIGNRPARCIANRNRVNRLKRLCRIIGRFP